MIAAAAAALMLVQGAPPASAASVAAAVDTSLAACEQWLLEPATWANSVDGFSWASGLASRGLIGQATVPDVALPPPGLRRALHHWRVPIGDGGVFVTASDQLPMCHLAGGGPEDLQPGVEAAFSTPAFAKRWWQQDTTVSAGLRRTRFVSNEDAKLTMTVTRAAAANAARDRVQFLATAEYQVGN